jgi:hypothetical protein
VTLTTFDNSDIPRNAQAGLNGLAGWRIRANIAILLAR